MKYQLYCDLDGVLVNFESSAVQEVNRAISKVKRLRESAYGPKFYRLFLKVAEQFGVEPENVPDIRISDFHKKDGINPPSRKLFYMVLSNHSEWWADLPWMADGQELWNFCKKFNPIIITAPMGEGSAKGKIEWVKKNLQLSEDRVRLTHEKFKFANFDGKTGYLIDDMEKFFEPWVKAGGEGVLHVSAAKTIIEMQKKGFRA